MEHIIPLDWLFGELRPSTFDAGSFPCGWDATTKGKRLMVDYYEEKNLL
jgi:hypothetical protein